MKKEPIIILQNVDGHDERERNRERQCPSPKMTHIYIIGARWTRCWSLLPYDFQLRSYLWLQRNTVDALALTLVCHVRIDLSGRDVLVTQHVLDGIDACTSIHL